MILSLPLLRPDSRRRLNNVFVVNYFLRGQGGNQLIRADQLRGARSTFVLNSEGRLSARRTVAVLDESRRSFIDALNLQLKGGERYPVVAGATAIALTAALGAGALALPAALAGGVLFAAGTAAIDAGAPDVYVLARRGDVIVHVEEVGVLSSRGATPIHVSAYFLCDPYRCKEGSPTGGWLIHEKRTEVKVPESVTRVMIG